MRAFTAVKRFFSDVHDDLSYAVANSIAKKCPKEFIQLLKSKESIRRQFWDFILDFQNFKKWPSQSKKALFFEAGFEGLATFYQHPKAIALVSALTLALLVLPSVPLALAFGAGALLPGAVMSLVLLTSLVVTSLLADIVGAPENTESTSSFLPV